MAKKTEQKGRKKKGPSGPTDTLREAVERTFAGASGGAAATRGRAQDLLEDIATQLRGLRDANLVGTLEGLRDDVQTLAKRVASLELRSDDGGAKKSSAKTPARRTPAKRATTAAKSTTSRAKSATSRAKSATPSRAKSTAAKAKPAAKKATTTRSTRGTTAKKKG